MGPASIGGSGVAYARAGDRPKSGDGGTGAEKDVLADDGASPSPSADEAPDARRDFGMTAAAAASAAADSAGSACESRLRSRGE